MKRCWFGGAVLVLLLVLGLLGSRGLGDFFTDASRQVAQAAQAEPEQAGELIRSVRERWQRGRRVHAMFYDHGPMEEIDALFALLDPETDTFRENCIRLSQALYALAQSQRPTLENLF